MLIDPYERTTMEPPSTEENYITLSMFQCIVNMTHYITSTSYDLGSIWSFLNAQSANTTDNSTMQSIQLVDTTEDKYAFEIVDKVQIQGMTTKAFAPGSLGKTIEYTQDSSRIGSLSVKFGLKHIAYEMKKINISVLIFKNGKIKISGGLGKMIFEKKMDDGLMNILIEQLIVKPVLRLCMNVSELPEYQIQKKMINANMRRPNAIGKDRYIGFIQNLVKLFGNHRVILPQIMQLDGKKRGRICAVKVKNEIGKSGSFAVDHSGNVQFFAYNNVDELRCHAIELLKIWL
jgi:hypothetical protein|uniref:Uncharacterized protein n=1 Tax=viral metagenome TaxID=1070528 RepID=A0A6C0BS02_9ZZZZ